MVLVSATGRGQASRRDWLVILFITAAHPWDWRREGLATRRHKAVLGLRRAGLVETSFVTLTSRCRDNDFLGRKEELPNSSAGLGGREEAALFPNQSLVCPVLICHVSLDVLMSVTSLHLHHQVSREHTGQQNSLHLTEHLELNVASLEMTCPRHVVV